MRRALALLLVSACVVRDAEGLLLAPEPEVDDAVAARAALDAAREAIAREQLRHAGGLLRNARRPCADARVAAECHDVALELSVRAVNAANALIDRQSWGEAVALLELAAELGAEVGPLLRDVRRAWQAEHDTEERRLDAVRIAREAERDARLAYGASVWSARCERCHGTSGRDVHDMTAGRWQHAWSDDELKSVIIGGIGGTDMAPFGDRLSPEQLDAVIHYLRALPKKSARVSNRRP